MKTIDLYRHRNNLYYDSLDDLMRGAESPEYVRLRWKKLKRVKGGKNG